MAITITLDTFSSCVQVNVAIIWFQIHFAYRSLGFMRAMHAAKFISWIFSLCCYIKGVSNSSDVQNFNFQVDQKILLLLFSGVLTRWSQWYCCTHNLDLNVSGSNVCKQLFWQKYDQKVMKYMCFSDLVTVVMLKNQSNDIGSICGNKLVEQCLIWLLLTHLYHAHMVLEI